MNPTIIRQQRLLVIDEWVKKNKIKDPDEIIRYVLIHFGVSTGVARDYARVVLIRSGEE